MKRYTVLFTIIVCCALQGFPIIYLNLLSMKQLYLKVSMEKKFLM
ncbi:hypothetical protein [Clostridium sp. Marseille-P299]|nr:hypothetical protein [Clostridium sp. Marseille-P299]